MGSPTIFKGKYTGLLSSKGILTKDNQLIENEGLYNYIKNNVAANGIQGWEEYDDGASAVPVDGTGGTAANITLSQDKTSKIRGETSFKIAKGAADAQGEGVSFDFDLSEIDKNRLMRISIEFDASSANYVAGDFTVYLISDTGGTPKLITPSVTAIPFGKSVFEATVVVEDQADVRLCLHSASTNANAFDLYFSSVKFTPELTVTANPTSESQPITLTFSKLPESSQSFFYRRDGDTMILSGRFSASGAATGTISASLPSGFSIDFSKLAVATYAPLGLCSAFDSSPAGRHLGIILTNGTSISSIVFSGEDGADLWNNSGVPFTWAVNDRVEIQSVEIPIAEWAGSVVTTANSRVQYVSHDGTSVVIGPQGAAMETDTPASLSESYDITSGIINPTDPSYHYQLEIQRSGVGAWTTHNLDVTPIEYDGSSYVGAAVSTSTNSVLMYRGKYRAGGSTTWATMPAGTRWRVAISSNPLGIGTGSATSTVVGAVLARKTYTETDTGSLTGTGWSTIKASFVPYQTVDGAWRMTFNISGTFTSSTNFTVTVPGITSENTTANTQAISCVPATSADWIYGYIFKGTAGFLMRSGTAQAGCSWNGDIELNSKPTWAD